MKMQDARDGPSNVSRAAGVFTVLFNRGQGMGDYWQGTYQYMDWPQLFDVVLFYIIFLIATLLLLGGFELAATYTSFREELGDKRNLPSLLSSGLDKVGEVTACSDRGRVDLSKCCCLTMVGMSCLGIRLCWVWWRCVSKHCGAGRSWAGCWGTKAVWWASSAQASFEWGAERVHV